MSEQTTESKTIMKERKRWGFLGLPWTFTKYTLMTKKVLISQGCFKSVENEILLYRIIDMTYSRTLSQKMFGLGTIMVYAKDKTTPVLEIKNIRHSREFREKLADAVEKDRLRMRMRQSELIDTDIGDFDSE